MENHATGSAVALAVMLVVTAALYAAGMYRRVRRVGALRARDSWRLAAFWAGLSALAVALSPQLDEWSDARFSAHVVQHQVLMLVAAPLLALARPTVCLWVLPQGWRRSLGRVIARFAHTVRRDAMAMALTAMVVFEAALTLWHWRPFYEAALENDGLHVAEHLTLLAAALALWSTVAQIRTAARGAAVLVLCATALYTGAVGALLAMSKTLWYPLYAVAPPLGLDPLADQQLAGLIMGISGTLICGVAALALAKGWLGGRPNAEEVRVARVRRRLDAWERTKKSSPELLLTHCPHHGRRRVRRWASSPPRARAQRQPVGWPPSA